ncbi:MAG TPA: sigma-70 family RNA polymerase sigma factor, partial [Acidimicrobiales bacterium]|nr:sigma-70 family RNA polymerase sigma factor [Acidimicrobiales bacterium]
LAGAEDRLLLSSLVPELPQRQQLILYLRFYEDMTQTAIAERLDISQMHVSRLLSRALGQLRDRARQANVASPSHPSPGDQRQGAA